MSLIRAFIALNISSEIKQHITAQTQPIIKHTKSFVRWVPSENLHITLKFLGDISSKQAKILSQTLGLVAANQPKFDIRIGEIGCYPNTRRPRVIWVDVQAPNELSHLFHTIEAATQKIGYPAEEKPFSPHLTISRVRPQANNAEITTLSEKLKSVKINFTKTVSITELHLFQSDLKPGGAIYTQLYTAKLEL